MRNQTIDLDGPVHYTDFGGDWGLGPVIVLVHGLGGANINWMGVAPALAERAHVVAPDLAGFGRTPAAARATSVNANRELLDRFIDAVANPPVVLVGNSMGGLISMLEAAATPEKVAGLVLVDPALPAWIDAVDPVVAQLFLIYGAPGMGEALVTSMLDSLGPEMLIRENFRLICADLSRVDEGLIQAHIDLYKDLAAQEEAMPDFLAATRSVMDTIQTPGMIAETVGHVEAPTLIVHGDRDRIVPLVAAQALHGLRPDWPLEVMEGVGHVPMFEEPERFVEIVLGWLEAQGLLGEEEARRTIARAGT